MKRVALIIGSAGPPDEYLPGVKVDVKEYKKFLLSPWGGNWYKEEIITSLDENIYTVYKHIQLVRMTHPDFAFVVFTGHGYYDSEREERVLMIGNDELYESELRGLAPRELLIIDSCAGIEEEIYKGEVLVEGLEKIGELIDYRKLYENAIEKCPPQEIILYASSPGEYSEDTSKGGLFSRSLLEIAYNEKIYEILRVDTLNALKAWELASEVVRKLSDGKQNPDYLATVRSGKKLPFSIRSLK